LGALEDLNAERSYKAMAQHMNTVAGNEILAPDAVARYPQVDVFGPNPGLVKTDIRSNLLGGNRFFFAVLEGLIGLFTPTPDQYAARIFPLMFSPDIEGLSGTMFDKTGQAILPKPGLTES
jgi:hypothetical protein